jgi:hypothetical protein
LHAGLLEELIKLEPSKVLAASLLADAVHDLDAEYRFDLSGQRSALLPKECALHVCASTPL